MNHGLLLVDKPKDWTSHDLVAKMRSLLKIKEVGHCGTLDPLATGLMVLLIGEATKLSQYILDGDKTYKVRVRFGLTTDSLDITGKPTSEQAVSLTRQQIVEGTKLLSGNLELQVPIYSAIKIKGEKLYQYARRNEEVSLPMKQMNFYRVETLETGTDWADFELECSKGSYVRSWVSELGKNLGCGAVVEELRRLESAPYKLSGAVTVDQVGAQAETGVLTEGFIPLAQCLHDWLSIRIMGADQTKILNGQISSELRHQIIASFKLGVHGGVKVISRQSGNLLALIGFEQGKGFFIRRVFRY